MPNRGRRLVRSAIVLLSVGGVLLAGCSSSKKGDGTPGGSPTSRTTRGVTATSIKVGGMMYSTFFGGTDVGAKARFDRANREGGVFGRKIDFVGAGETNAEQATTSALALKLVTQEQVFALVPVVSTQLAISGVVDGRNVPVFGFGVDPVFCGDRRAFAISGCVADPSFKVSSTAAGQVMKSYFHGSTDKSAAVIGQDFDAGRGAVKLSAGSLSSVGFHVVYAKNPLPAPPAPVGDYSPFVSELLRSDNGHAPDMIYVLVPDAGSIGLFQALQGAGYKGIVTLAIYDPRVAPVIQGAAVISQFAPFEAAPQIPRMQQMISDVRAVNPKQQLTSGVAAGYWSADMFLALLRKTGPDLTVERMLAASQGWSYGVPGIVGTSQWPANHSLPVPCAALVLAQDNTFVPNVPLTCGKIIRMP